MNRDRLTHANMMKSGHVMIRFLFARVACFVSLVAIGHVLCAETVGGGPSTVRDHFWIWAHIERAYDNSWGLPRNGRITPVEGAYYLGVPNIIFIRYEGKPAPPFEQYAVPFRPLKRVYWSIVGGGGTTSDEEREQVFKLAANMPNMVGMFMDDFFQFSTDAEPQAPAGKDSEAPAALTLDQLRKVREKLVVNGRRLDLAVTLYTTALDKPGIRSHLEHCDVISLWTWEAKDLPQLEENFTRYRAMFPNKRTLLGCYMWDFGASKPMPIDLMKKQCEFGLRMLREGQIEGLIFLASNICDLDLETVEWTRRWIAEVGDQPLRAMDN